MNNTLLDLLNSSYPTQPHSLIAKYVVVNFLLILLFSGIVMCANKFETKEQLKLTATYTTAISQFIVWCRVSF